MYVIVDPASKRLCRTRPNDYGHSQFNSPGDAMRSLVAYIKRKMKYGSKREQEEALTYFVMSLEEYNKAMRTTKTVRNLMTGKEVEIDINTPLSCDPSSETYWSM